MHRTENNSNEFINLIEAIKEIDLNKITSIITATPNVLHEFTTDGNLGSDFMQKLASKYKLPTTGFTPLHFAIITENIDIVDTLLKEDKNKTLIDKHPLYQSTALYVAVYLELPPQMIQCLLKHGANIQLLVSQLLENEVLDNKKDELMEKLEGTKYAEELKTEINKAKENKSKQEQMKRQKVNEAEAEADKLKKTEDPLRKKVDYLQVCAAGLSDAILSSLDGKPLSDFKNISDEELNVILNEIANLYKALIKNHEPSVLITDEIVQTHLIQTIEELFKPRCEIFLMMDAQNGNHKISDKNHFYLYKEKDNKIFYYPKGENQKFYLEDENEKSLQFPAEFNSSGNNLVKLDNEELIKSILTITANNGHTLIAFEEADKEESRKKLISAAKKRTLTSHKKEKGNEDNKKNVTTSGQNQEKDPSENFKKNSQMQSADPDASDDYFKFKLACKELKQATAMSVNNPDSELKEAGRDVLQTARQAYENGEISQSDLPKLTKFVNGTKDVVRDPANTAFIDQHRINTEKAIGMNRQWGKLVGGAMLSFLGVALVTLSVVVAVATFGGSAPLSAAGLALGGSMVAAGFTVGVAAISGLGLATTAGIFADRARKGSIAMAGERVTEVIKSTNPNKKI